MKLLAPCLIASAVFVSTTSQAETTSIEGRVQIGLDLTLEGRSVLSGSAEGESVSTGVADVSVQWRVEGWTGFFNVVAPFGTSLTAGPLADFGVVSNIDSEALPRLQEAWVERRLGATDVRVGMMALDTEFWGSNQASLFHNSAFGAPTFMSASIPNLGVYPAATFGIRARKHLVSDKTLSVAVVDGDPGDIASVNPRGTKIHAGNGILALAELADHQTKENGHGEGWKVGGFLHTGDFSSDDSFTSKEGNVGVFALIERSIAADVSAFVRAGAGRASRGASPRSVEAGVVLHRPLDLHGDFGFGAAHITINPFGDADVPSAERILEATYRLPINDEFVIQADLQQIRPSGSVAARASSLVAGLRIYVAL